MKQVLLLCAAAIHRRERKARQTNYSDLSGSITQTVPSERTAALPRLRARRPTNATEGYMGHPDGGPKKFMTEKEQHPAPDPRLAWCPQCSKKFKHAYNLKRHLRVCHQVCLYPCDYCNASFNRSDNLLKHVREKHRVDRSSHTRISDP